MACYPESLIARGFFVPFLEPLGGGALSTLCPGFEFSKSQELLKTKTREAEPADRDVV